MGISEKTIAEFIIDQAKSARSHKEFTKVTRLSINRLAFLSVCSVLLDASISDVYSLHT